jgi:hypothetical protein
VRCLETKILSIATVPAGAIYLLIHLRNFVAIPVFEGTSRLDFHIVEAHFASFDHDHPFPCLYLLTSCSMSRPEQRMGLIPAEKRRSGYCTHFDVTNVDQTMQSMPRAQNSATPSTYILKVRDQSGKIAIENEKSFQRDPSTIPE